ncbi:hypothetical protein AB5I39_13240 [Sphingomonas sp. MMS24-J45]|uniref:hypothetical protein n=1 Tax=Sphingomonas sp. MMS24-J45 TaxID=3238806 RepID=UPI00384E9DDC
MSRDQRPGRVKLIDAGAASPPMRRIGDVPGTEATEAAAPPAAAPPVPKAPTLLWAAVFLIACIAGAALVTLFPLVGIG